MNRPDLSHSLSSIESAESAAALFGQAVNRRRFLSLLGAAGAVGATACSGPSRPARSTSSTAPAAVETSTSENAALAPADSLPVPSSDAPERRRPANPKRRLVVIEMSGGNDGLAMLQPYESAALRDRRPGLLSEDSELIDAGGGFGWHPTLADLAGMGIGAVVGVGSNEPSFSHFEMEQRWWRGVSEDNSRVSTGFFGRLCDQLDVGDPVTGLSFSGGPTPGLLADKAVTVGLRDPNASWFFRQDEPWFDMLRSTFGAMAEASADDTARFEAARAGLNDTLRFADSLAEIPESDDEVYPRSDLGEQLRLAADVMSLDVGVRVLHVRQGGFDTHSGQQWRHGDLMSDLNEALGAFVGDLQQRNMMEDTLVVTTSEFGRRVSENEQGTDHGGASTMLVCGAGATGVHGDAPNLNKLDDDNVVATARFEDYYATIADHWFGIAPEDVLPTGGTPITGLI